MSVVVVGAGLAGLRTGEALRRQGYPGEVTLVGAERHPPYSRPPLSKEVLRGDKPPQSAQLRAPDELDALGLTLRLGTRAVALDVAGRAVKLDSGETVTYDDVVIATGARPRTIPGVAELAGVHVLRTLDDSAHQRADLRAGRRLVVVGAGFIGSEVAASARAMGCDVTIVEALPVPLARALGEPAGAALGRLHADNGVDLRCGVGVAAVEGDEQVERVVLSDGTVLPADVVVVGIGVTPVTEWLDGSGLTVDDGVVCDESCRAAPGVWAVGDVARWHNPLFDESMRVEHWTNASEQPAVVARSITSGEPVPYPAVPYFWSDQYDAKISYLGRPGGGEEMRVVLGGLDEQRFVAVFRHGDRLGGVLGLRAARYVMRLRPLLAARAPWEEALEVAGGLS